MAWKGTLASVRLNIQGRNIELTDAIKSHAEEKLGHAVEHYAHLVRQIEVRISARVGRAARGPQLLRCEVTVFTKKHGVVRAEEETSHMYTSIDSVSNIIRRKLHKIKEKDGGRVRPAKSRHVPRPGQVLTDEIVDLDPILQKEQDDLPDEIVRVKYFEMPPLTLYQALEMLNNVGHDFYVFRDIKTGEINIVYKRRHDGYGLIVPHHSSTGDNGGNGPTK
jgi:ribosomal subunit interface protein